MRTLGVGNLEVQAKMVVAGGLMVVEDARRRYANDKRAADVLASFGVRPKTSRSRAISKHA